MGPTLENKTNRLMIRLGFYRLSIAISLQRLFFELFVSFAKSDEKQLIQLLRINVDPSLCNISIKRFKNVHSN